MKDTALKTSNLRKERAKRGDAKRMKFRGATKEANIALKMLLEENAALGEEIGTGLFYAIYSRLNLVFPLSVGDTGRTSKPQQRLRAAIATGAVSDACRLALSCMSGTLRATLKGQLADISLDAYVYSYIDWELGRITAMGESEYPLFENCPEHLRRGWTVIKSWHEALSKGSANPYNQGEPVEMATMRDLRKHVAQHLRGFDRPGILSKALLDKLFDTSKQEHGYVLCYPNALFADAVRNAEDVWDNTYYSSFLTYAPEDHDTDTFQGVYKAQALRRARGATIHYRRDEINPESVEILKNLLRQDTYAIDTLNAIQSQQWSIDSDMLADVQAQRVAALQATNEEIVASRVRKKALQAKREALCALHGIDPHS